MKLLLWLISIMVIPVSNVMAAPSLCSKDEKIIFSCSTSKTKIVSLCASSSLNTTSGYLQYRFGKQGQRPELIYPEVPAHPSTYFEGGTLAYAGGGGTYLRFNRSQYSYTAFSGIGRGWEKAGLSIEKSGKQIANLSCKDEPISEIGPDFFDQAGIPESNSSFEIP